MSLSPILVTAFQNAKANMWYGIEIDTTVATTALKRIGNMSLHRSLPIHSKIKGCLLSDTGIINKFLPDASWVGEILDGSQGQVMTLLPGYFCKWEVLASNIYIQQISMSEFPLPGYTWIPPSHYSSYEASKQHSTGKLCSVMNTSADYRGGDNNATYDLLPNTRLGMPITNTTRTNFRTYARNRNAGDTRWNMHCYVPYKSLFWLYYVEYANTNCQLAYNPAPDSNGFKQGGLGIGVTDWDSNWNTFNGNNPFVPCGTSNSLGNGTGEVLYTVPSTPNKVVRVNRYRSIELPFGHIWENTDQVTIDVKTDAQGGTSAVFIASNPALFNDSNTTGYEDRGQLPRTLNYVKTVLFGAKGDILPATLQGSSTQYWSDYFYEDHSGSSLRTVLLGGGAHLGAYAGFGSAYVHSEPSTTATYFGSRLCFIP